MNLRGYVSVSDAAEIRGVSRQAILELIARGRLRAERVGRDWLIQRTALKQFKKMPPGKRRAEKTRRQ